MNVQKELLENYLKKFSNPTLKEIAADTGLNISRVFRLLNGSKMRLSEYLIFKNLVDDAVADKTEEEFLSLIKRLNDSKMKNEIFAFVHRALKKENLKLNQKNHLQELGA
jgi:hypothetical protein